MAPILRGSKPSVSSSPTVSSSVILASLKERLAILELIISQHSDKISVLEKENEDLKATISSLSTPSSPAQHFFTPKPTTVVKPKVVKENPLQPVVRSLQFSDAAKSNEGQWIIVKNEKDKVIKKIWKNSSEHSSENKSSSINNNNNNHRNDNRNRNKNRNKKRKFKRNNNDVRNNTRHHHQNNNNGFRDNQNELLDNLMTNLSDFLMHRNMGPRRPFQHDRFY